MSLMNIINHLRARQLIGNPFCARQIKGENIDLYYTCQKKKRIIIEKKRSVLGAHLDKDATLKRKSAKELKKQIHDAENE